MSSLACARDSLRAEGCICSAADDGAAVLFCAPVGCGRITETPAGDVRLHFDVSAVADDPVVYARMSSRVGPARITLRHRTPVAVLTCPPAGIAAALRGIVSLWGPAPHPALPVVDAAVGVLTEVPPVLTGPAFVRLGRPANTIIDRARATYLLVANARLRSGKGGWLDGPGLAVGPECGPQALGSELFEVGHALYALGEERIARSYLELCGMKTTTQPRGPTATDRAATTEGGVR